jgi:DNA recombination protein RmuC
MIPIEAVYIGLGTIIGACITFVIMQRRQINADHLLVSLKDSFKALSSDALKDSSDQLLKLAEAKFISQTDKHSTELTSKKELIDIQLKDMKDNLGKVSELVSEFEKKREEKLGAIGKELDSLTKTSNDLHKLLADNRSRGQWGERMVEDLLNLAGLHEGINYRKQCTIENSSNGSGKSRPDFTFILPNDLELHMDVKFPLDNYQRYLQAEAQADQEKFRDQFLKDVKNRIGEIEKREYTKPSNSLNAVIIFIPNEGIFRFINQEDDTIVTSALEKRIILCSPITLFIVLAVVRQAVDNFHMAQSARNILDVLKDFRDEWGKYVEKTTKLGDAIENVRKHFDELITTRQKALDKRISKVDRLIEAPQAEDDMLPSPSAGD